MITYSKRVTGLNAYKQHDGLTNVVFSIHWSLVAEENGVTSSCPAITDIPYIPNVGGQSFVSFENLTEQDVIAWIDMYTPAVRMQQYENSASFSLTQQQSQEAPTLPWAPPMPSATP